jgi:hypothetical protein
VSPSTIYVIVVFALGVLVGLAVSGLAWRLSLRPRTSRRRRWPLGRNRR